MTALHLGAFMPSGVGVLAKHLVFSYSMVIKELLAKRLLVAELPQ